MAVETRAGQGNKQLARLDRTAVDADAIERGIGDDHAAIERASQFAQFQVFKHESPPTRSVRDQPRPDQRSHDAGR
ncbi:hypothetical protein D3C76_1849590 [compost metagenome]